MSKNKCVEDNNPFELLLEEMDAPLKPVDMKKIAKMKDEHRSKMRQNLTGNAIVYDLNQKLITKAVLRNLSPTGVGFEIHPVDLRPNASVYVQFSNADIDLGLLLCHVQWIAGIEGHIGQHKMIGLKFEALTPMAKSKLSTFLDTLKNPLGYTEK